MMNNIHETEEPAISLEESLKLLKDLADHQWREFDHKTRHEWKLSFSIWAGLLASMTALLSGEVKFPEASTSQILTLFGVSIVISIILLHFWFLWWIQGRLQMIRIDAWEIYKKRWNKIFPTKKNIEPFRSRINQPSLWVQFGITVLLSVTLLIIFKAIVA